MRLARYPSFSIFAALDLHCIREIDVRDANPDAAKT